MAKVYDATKVTIIRDDKVATDFADGDMASWTKTNDNASITEDAQGNSTINVSGSKSGSITITVLETSPMLPILIADANARKIAPIKIKVPLPGGQTETVGGEEGIIQKNADGTVAGTAPSRAFTFLIPEFSDITG
jgi:hypothetical protein